MNTIKTTESKPHPAYQNSGVAWIGDMPEQWKVVRLKDICGFEYGDSLPEEERTSTGVPVYGSNGLIGYAHTANTKPQCLIIGRKGSSGKVIYSDEAGFAIDTTFFVDRRHTTSNTKWLYYLLTALDLESLSGDVGVPGLNRTRAYQQICPLPTLVEQAAIVRYLDDADQRIRAYVSAKERLIALLQEERQAVIHQAVTRGLDPNVTLKPSGVEWLGDVPEHWEIGPMKRFAAKSPGAIKTGPFGSQLTAAEMSGTEFKVYTQRNVIDRNLEKGVNYISHAKFQDLRAFEVFQGDVLVTSRGTIGRTALVTEGCERGVLHPCLIRIQPDHGCLVPEFLMMLIQDSQILPRQLAYLSNATTIDVIYSSTLANIIVPVPPIAEQSSIVRYLDEATGQVEAAMGCARRQVELMEEYHTRLIADVVTGKIDVRTQRVSLSRQG